MRDARRDPPRAARTGNAGETKQPGTDLETRERGGTTIHFETQPIGLDIPPDDAPIGGEIHRLSHRQHVSSGNGGQHLGQSCLFRRAYEEDVGCLYAPQVCEAPDLNGPSGYGFTLEGIQVGLERIRSQNSDDERL